MVDLRPARPPERIVCLTEEPTEILYALGQEERIVGVSAYTERPPEAKRDRPVVSAFIGGSIPKIRALAPDLILGFSDIQADLARDLLREGLPVLIFNQRSIIEILDVILAIGSIVGAQDAAQRLVDSYRIRLEAARARERSYRPRVYFEEWDEPTFCGIRWISELIELAGGVDIFADRSRAGAMARDRKVSTAEIVDGAPEVVLASWCGKAFDAEAFASRPGFGELPAIRSGRVHELDPAIILQPGPACLTDGLDLLEQLLHPGGD